MTAAEQSHRNAALQADAWADKAEASGRLADAATLMILASAAQEKADNLAKAASTRPQVLQSGVEPDPSTSCALCGAHGVRPPNSLLIACTNPDCCRYGVPIAAAVF